MKTLTIAISDEKLQQLQKLAQKADMTPEQLLTSQLDKWLNEPEDDFQQVTRYVLEKNRELYQRLS
ncbi:MAG: DNA-binding protein [Cyanobacteria bacterium SBLK]|nr:DNA-binding protein [Cyanobacteria bacterium SBLK]